MGLDPRIEGIYRLLIAMYYERLLTVEQAFELYDTGEVRQVNEQYDLTIEDIEDMKIMREQGKTYREIAETYNIKDQSNIFYLIKRNLEG